MKKIRFVFAVAVLSAAIVFASMVPMTMARTAGRAARCLGWPDDVVVQTTASFRSTTTKLNEPALLVFEHAKLVSVTRLGRCSAVRDTEFVSGRPLMHLPPMAQVPGERQDYILYYLGKDNGNAVFVGVRAGTRKVPFEGDPKGDSI